MYDELSVNLVSFEAQAVGGWMSFVKPVNTLVTEHLSQNKRCSSQFDRKNKLQEHPKKRTKSQKHVMEKKETGSSSMFKS